MRLTQRRRHIASRVATTAAVNILVLLIGLVLFELCFGGWIRSNAIARLNIPWNTSATFDVRGLYDSSSGYVIYSRDRFGLRGEYPSPDRIDILTVGGSTTDQRAISDGETWQDVLRADFAREGRSVTIVNAGVDGQSTHGHLKNFTLWFPEIPRLKARYILFYVGLNDFYFGAGSNYDALDTPHEIPAWWGPVQDRSAFFYMYRTIKGMYAARVVYGIGHRRSHFGDVGIVDKPLQIDHASLMRDHLRAYEERLRLLTSIVSTLGARAILVTQRSYSYKSEAQPVLGIGTFMDYGGYPINGVDHHQMMTLLNQTTMRVCSETQSVCVDLARDLRFEDSDFYDGAHNTPSGAAKVGHYLFSQLRNLDW